MNKSKRVVSSVMLASYLVNPAINVFAEELKDADISNLENEAQNKILPDTKSKNNLQYVYLDGSANPTEDDTLGTEANPTNSFEKALDLVSKNGFIYVKGEVNIPDDIEMPNKQIFIKNKEDGKLKFGGKLYLNSYLDIKDIAMEFTSNDKDCVFLNGNMMMNSNVEIIGKPNVFLGSENRDINFDGDGSGAFYINNNKLSNNAIGNINLGGKDNYTLSNGSVVLNGVM